MKLWSRICRTISDNPGQAEKIMMLIKHLSGYWNDNETISESERIFKLLKTNGW